MNPLIHLSNPLLCKFDKINDTPSTSRTECACETPKTPHSVQNVPSPCSYQSINFTSPSISSSAFSMHQLLPANPVPSTYLLNCDSPFPRPPPPYCRPNVSLIEDIEEYSPSAAQCFDFINGCSENYGDDDADSIASLDSLNSSCLSFDVEFCDSPFELVLTNQHTHFALEHCFNHDTPLTSLEEPEANWAQSVHVTPSKCNTLSSTMSPNPNITRDIDQMDCLDCSRPFSFDSKHIPMLPRDLQFAPFFVPSSQPPPMTPLLQLPYVSGYVAQDVF